MAWRRYLDNWGEDFCYSYILLNDGISAEMLSEQFHVFNKKYMPPEQQARNSFSLQPLVDIHLKSNLEDEIEIGSQTGTIQIYILLSIALFILVIAIINYIEDKIFNRISHLFYSIPGGRLIFKIFYHT